HQSRAQLRGAGYYFLARCQRRKELSEMDYRFSEMSGSFVILRAPKKTSVRRGSPDRADSFDRKVFPFGLFWETFGRTMCAVRRPAHNTVLFVALMLLPAICRADRIDDLVKQ